MNRLLAFGVLLVVAGVASADVAPPKGLKRVTLDNKITTDKEYPDYEFFTVIGRGGVGKGGFGKAKGGDGVTAVKLDPKTPIEIKGAGRGAGIGRLGYLVAVPKDSGKKYASEGEFHQAIRDGKVEGLVRAKTQLDALTTIKDTDTRTTVTREYKLEKIDPKEGIVLTAVKPDGDKATPPKGEEGEEGLAAGYAPQGGGWVAGVAATGAVVLFGLWFARRGRRELA
jgi:hypothetical protein